MTLLNYRKSVAVLLPDTLFIVTVPVIHFLYAVQNIIRYDYLVF
ncbi:hypothetical protein HMPREF1094_02975 [[Clostridium] innocuum 2959]|uniref:Uncharacterized protein n=1 Tax=[Clostridium] innocuum 2959 TaxID=999413 RepID=N9WNU5_CLOIN|nr:hypothetical protein HMPREF1094_02975 [[Clostridium] innocuum 2959]